VEPVNVTSSAWRTTSAPTTGPGLDQQAPRPQCGQRRLGVRLHHDGVPGGEGGKRVPGGQFERVVPRRDVAHHAPGVAQFADARQHGERAGVAAGPQVTRRGAAVVAGRRGDGLHLLVGGQPRLAGFELDEVEDLVLAAQQQVVAAQQHRGAVAHRARGPVALGRAGAVEGGGDVLRVRLGEFGEPLTGQRAVAGGGRGRARHAARQPVHEPGSDHARGVCAQGSLGIRLRCRHRRRVRPGAAA
jgi:hypothetical protein